MYQSASLIHGDEIPSGMPVNDLNDRLFAAFYEKQFDKPLADQDLSLIAQNLNLAKDGILNIAGTLLFTDSVQYKLPAFIVKCVVYPNNSIDESEYLDSQDIAGTMRTLFDTREKPTLICRGRSIKTSLWWS